MDVEGEDEGAVAERDRREPRDAEARLELAVDRRVLQVGEDDPLLEGPADRPVRPRDGEPLGDLPGAPEPALEDVVVVFQLVEAAPDDPELGAEVPDDGFADGGDRGDDVVAPFDGGEGLFDVLEE